MPDGPSGAQTPGRNGARRLDRRAKLVAVAAEMFRQRGFVQVGVDDIGAAAGLSGPAVYRYFAGKQELLEEVVASYLLEVRSELERCVTVGGQGQPVVPALVAAGLRAPNSLVVHSRQTRYLSADAATRIRAIRADLAEECSALVPVLGPASADAGSDDDLRARCAAGVVAHVALARPGTLPLKTQIAGEIVAAHSLMGVTPRAEIHPESPPTARRLAHVTRREAVLVAATELMSERGFVAVSLNDIGSRVGITASAVMRHFTSKEALLSAVVSRGGEQISAGLAVAIRESRDASEAVHRIVGMYAQLAVDHRDVIVIQTTEAASLPEDQRAERRRRHRMYVDELAHLISQASTERTKNECRLRAGIVFAVINEAVISPAIVQREGIVRDLTQMGMAAASGMEGLHASA